ncbi:SH3 domain-containing protein [Arenimonas caeni]|nr:SH3 domain-containing protein [Arenimonas caeni]
MGWDGILTIAFLGLLLAAILYAGLTDSSGSRASRSEGSSARSAQPNPPQADSPPLFPRAFVTAQRANVRSGPGTSWAPVTQVDQMTEVSIISEEGGWSNVQLPGGQDGYISSSLLERGTFQEVRNLVCKDDEKRKPYSGEILKQTLTGQHQLTVNAGSQDVLVKLRQGTQTVLAFYVNQGQSGVVRSVPEGHFNLMFASGEEFSRKCLEFMSAMQVTADPNTVAFVTTYESDGYNNYQSRVAAEYTLTRVSQGNFVPRSVSADDFRE